MTFTLVTSDERGVTKLPWLDSKHSFSFGRYVNPARERFGRLIVFNDDVIAPGKGFGGHPHENAEIVTFVFAGSVQHQDSMGNTGIIKAGEMQRISAGSGIMHAEMNASKTEEVHLFQIWLEPQSIGGEPSYEQGTFADKLIPNKLVPLVSGRHTSTLYLNQDAAFLMGTFDSGETISFELEAGYGRQVFCIAGSVRCRDVLLRVGDSLEITGPESISLTAEETSQLLVIDVPV